MFFPKDTTRREPQESTMRMRTTFELIFRPKLFDVPQEESDVRRMK